MTRDKIIALMQLLGERVYKEYPEWISFKCPFSAFRHATGKDQHPSFAISIRDASKSYFKCFTCHTTITPLIKMPHTLWSLTKQYPNHIIRFILDNEIMEEPKLAEGSELLAFDWLAKRRQRTRPKNEIISTILEQLVPLTTDQGFLFVNTISFLHYIRKISLTSLAFYDICSNHELKDSVVFPITNKREVVSLSARRIDRKTFFRVKPGMLDIPGELSATLPGWFGLKQSTPTKPIMLVEGELDALRVHTLGFPNVIAGPGCNVSNEQLAMLSNEAVYLGFDADKAGKEAAQKTLRFFNDRRVYSLDWGLVDCKDPGELRDEGELEYVLEHKKIVRNY